jgi:large subunit ribosomal protein L5
MISIHEKYNSEVIAQMKSKFKLGNDLEVPRIMKVVVNAGVGKYLKDSSQTDEVSRWITAITGQKPLLTKARHSIAGFKIREGLEVGMKVTLRGRRMWNFIARLVQSALPRVRDFQGLKNSAVDSKGNLNIGIKEHLIFPEVVPEQVKNIFSFQVTIVTNAENSQKGTELFRLLGFPMAKEK